MQSGKNSKSPWLTTGNARLEPGCELVTRRQALKGAWRLGRRIWESFTSLRSSNCNIHLTSNLSIISGDLPVIKSMMRNNCKIWTLFSLALKLFSSESRDSALLRCRQQCNYSTLRNRTVTLELAQVPALVFTIIPDLSIVPSTWVTFSRPMSHFQLCYSIFSKSLLMFPHVRNHA